MDYQGGEKEYERLAIALSIHREAAYCSTSWGAFQIMGFHHVLCGFRTVDDFVAAQHHSCHKQLDAFCQFLVANNLQLYLQKRDWAAFARLYNGPEYLRNQYDKNQEIAYRGCQNAHSDVSEIIHKLRCLSRFCFEALYFHAYKD